MGAVRIQATIQDVDIPNVEKFLKEILAKELEIELEK